MQIDTRDDLVAVERQAELADRDGRAGHHTRSGL
jgi:hypothetical protein